ncbi:hypothetical protein BDY21DRAFT_343021, partial [Lineolata rhizophorae]
MVGYGTKGDAPDAPFVTPVVLGRKTEALWRPVAVFLGWLVEVAWDVVAGSGKAGLPNRRAEAAVDEGETYFLPLSFPVLFLRFSRPSCPAAMCNACALSVIVRAASGGVLRSRDRRYVITFAASLDGKRANFFFVCMGTVLRSRGFRSSVSVIVWRRWQGCRAWSTVSGLAA